MDANSKFLKAWCLALKQLFEAYGATLAKRPWEVYFLDLRSLFAHVDGFCDPYGNAHLRDVTKVIDGYQNPQPPQITPLPQYQLGQNVLGSTFAYDEIFFIHDEVRNVYFWGATWIKLGHQSLYAQHALTGQRLAPSVDLSADADYEGYLVSYAMSPDGKFIALVYDKRLIRPKNEDFPDDKGQLTVIWQIEERLIFTRRMHSEPWARIVFNRYSNNDLFSSDGRYVVFSDDGHCFSPSGDIDLTSGSVRPLREGLDPSAEDPTCHVNGSFFSSNGKDLFISEFGQADCQARRISLFEYTPPIKYSWPETKQRVIDVSPNGRYLVLFEIANRPHSIYLYDTGMKETIELSCPECYVDSSAKYHFSKDETKLVAFLPCVVGGIAIMNVVIWDQIPTKQELRSHAKLKMDSLIRTRHVFVHEDEKSALLVTGSRLIQRVELGDDISFPEASGVNDDYPRSFSSVSADGRKWALVSYGQHKGQMQLVDLDSGTVFRRLELEWTPCDPELLTFGLSPDLNMLVIDAQVFDLGQDDRIASIPFTIAGLPELLECRRHKEGILPSHWCLLFECSISPCNSYVLFVSEGSIHELDLYPTELHLFRIDLMSKSSTKLHVPLPENLVSASANFHPSLPLMSISYAAASKAELEALEQEPPQLNLAILEIGSSEAQPVEIPERLLPLIKK